MKYTFLALSFLLSTALFALPAKASAAARFYLSPSSGSYNVGDTISASVMIDSGGAAINAGEASVSFSSDLIEYQAVSTSGSIFTFWTSGPTGSSTTVNFSGGLSNPGYTGGAGKLLTISWKAKATGTATVTVNGSKILANDGLGTNLYSTSSGGSFVIGQPQKSAAPQKSVAPAKDTVKVTSSTHPNQDSWYQARSVKLAWSGGTGQYSYLFNQSATAEPTARFTSEKAKTYDNVADGVWYLHIKGKTSSGTTATTHFKVQVDGTAPEEFTAVIEQDAKNSNPQPKVTFTTTDATSGIDHYEAVVDKGEAVKLASGDALPKQLPGDHELTIKAFDKAGNVRESKVVTFSITGISPPVITYHEARVAVLSPITFRGQSDIGDTIHVFLDGKHVADFAVRDKKISGDTDVTWEYKYTDLLGLGKHSFKFSRTNSAGAESGLTQPYTTEVIAAAVALWGHVYPALPIIILLLIVILILIIIIIMLLIKIRRLKKHIDRESGYSDNDVKKYLTQIEQKLEQSLTTTIPNHQLSGEEVRAIKHELKSRVLDAVTRAKDQLDKR